MSVTAVPSTGGFSEAVQRDNSISALHQTLACSNSNRKTHGFGTFSHFGHHVWNNLSLSLSLSLHQDIPMALVFSHTSATTSGTISLSLSLSRGGIAQWLERRTRD